MVGFRLKTNLNSKGHKMLNNVYAVDDIDWNQIWRSNTGSPFSVEDWDERAASYSEYAIKSQYATNFINLLQPQPQWTVFDMGCGSGTLALPLAEKVQAVTAADFSPKMLATLTQHALARNLSNITPLELSWTDNWEILPAKSHDIAIASRSMLVDDFRNAVEKLIEVARHGVYLALPVNADPENDLVCQALDKKIHTSPDYSCCYNILYQMGIRANINILTEYSFKAYTSREEILQCMTTRYVKDLDAMEMQTLKNLVNSRIICINDNWYYEQPRPYQCAVIWWNTK